MLILYILLIIRYRIFKFAYSAIMQKKLDTSCMRRIAVSFFKFGSKGYFIGDSCKFHVASAIFTVYI